MTRMHAAANNQWQDYIARVRAELATLNQDQIEEIIRDLEVHIDDELSSIVESGQTVGETDITAIISRLGEPAAIAEAYGIEPSKPGAIDSFSVSMLISSLFLIAIIGFFPVMQLALIPGSAVLARIALAQPGVMQSSYRWAAYPGLAVAYSILILLVLFWPLIPVLPLAATGGILPQLLIEENAALQPGSVEYWAKVWSLALIVTGIWWLILIRILRNRKAMLARVFFPFVQIANLSFNKILIPGGLLQMAGAVVVILIY